jgi:sarcosine oxidase
LKVERQVLLWFEPKTSPEAFTPERCPVHLWQFDGHRFFYGFPAIRDGVKVAFHHAGETTTADAVRRTVEPQEIESMREVLRRFLPAADGPLRLTAVCLYTNTPNEHFLIDRHPRLPQVLMASPCSGHGFKFSAAIGETLADLVQGARPRVDVSLFHLRQTA